MVFVRTIGPGFVCERGRGFRGGCLGVVEGRGGAGRYDVVIVIDVVAFCVCVCVRACVRL